MSKLINLFGGAGIGKSSIANGITYKLKKKHISCNNPYEFPKRLAWDKNIPNKYQTNSMFLQINTEESQNVLVK